MKIRQHIPNLLTCSNLVFGCFACIEALSGDYFCAMIAIFIAAVFDFADGLAARVLRAYSPIGKDLDSLADIVSFGVAPGMMLYDFLDRTQKTVDWNHPLTGSVFLFAALAVPIFSALRLAKFNNDDRQTTSFIGLPVPAHALFWASLIYFLSIHSERNAIAGIFPQFISIRLPAIPSLFMLLIISVSAIGSSLLLVTKIPMFSLKFNSLAWKGNELRYVILIAALVFILCFGSTGIALTVLLYILLSRLHLIHSK